MILEAVWFKNGKEVFNVSPVMNIVCENQMSGIEEIEIFNGRHWYTYDDFDGSADDFMIRVKRD